MTGKYLIFEGLDGSGKSTLAEQVLGTLRGRGTPAAALQFPGRLSAAGRAIRDSFEGKIDVNPNALMWYFVAEGVDMQPRIEAMLTEGVWVLCDRHTMYSGYVYQSPVHGVAAVHDVSIHGEWRFPDYLYVIDIPPQVSLDRRKKRNEPHNKLYESERLDKLASMRQEYLQLAEREAEFNPVRVLDGTRPIEENVGLILGDLETT